MLVGISGRKYPALMAAALAFLAAGPVRADVKAGVDAWTAGDYVAAVKEWKKPAEQGDPDAQFNMAQAYKMGFGVERDLAKAEDLYAKAAARGHLQAADNYGLLLFQRGERTRAMPFIQAAADRGDARAQYVLGLAYFNGDNMPKDWVRAYALVSLAQQAGLAQAAPALAQMDQYIPLDQRQQSVPLAAELARKADANRASQIAAMSLGGASPAMTASATPALPSASTGRPTVASAAEAVAQARRASGPETPATAGADYARPKPRPKSHVPQVAQMLEEATPEKAAKQPPTSKPAAPAKPAAAPKPTATPKPAVEASSAATGGPWRVQLGAFGVDGNADKLWRQLAGRPELAGHEKLLVPAGRLTKLQAGGFATRAAAQAACSRLTSAGIACLAVRD